MIRLKVFISSVQKELRAKRIVIGSFLSTEEGWLSSLSSTSSPSSSSDRPAAELILEAVQRTGSITTRDCKRLFGMSRDKAWRTLSTLTDNGSLRRSGTGRGTTYLLNSHV